MRLPHPHIKRWRDVNKKHFFTVIGLAFTFVIMMSTLWVFWELHSIPKVNPQTLNTYAPTKIEDKNGNVIWQSTTKHVTTMKYSEIPSLYKNALIATEDENFYKNQGYSIKGVTTAVASTVLSKVIPSLSARGGSTIEQQLIKNQFFDGGLNMSTTTRKVQEIFLARQLDHNFTKNQILTYYVNSLDFAQGDKGAASVMMTYFGKKPSDYKTHSIQNIAQTAYIAGLGQNPTSYDLYTYPKLGDKRKNIVLGVMKDHGQITNEQYRQAINYDLTKDLKPRFWEAEQQRQQNLKYKAYTDGVLAEVAKMGYNLDDIDMTIKTYLDPKTFDEITEKVRQDQYYQDGSQKKEQVAATIIDKNGIVQGMVGGRNSTDEFNRAIQRSRSSGSSLKPFTAYGPLFQYFGNKYNTASAFDSGAYQYPGTNLFMQNFGGATYGTVDAQRALRLSLNTVVARIDDQILGSTRMKTFLNQVGLDVKDSYSANDGIGLYISTLDAAAAWNTINNGGTYIQPRFVDKLYFADGTSKNITPTKYQAMNQSTAYVLSQMARGVVSQGYTGAQGAISKYEGYAGKTGLVGLNENSTATDTFGKGGTDSWFDTITNNGYAISLWFGYDSPNNSPQVADSFDGPQWLGRDLQLQLTGNKDHLDNWSKPDTVKTLSGSGLDTQYAVTDSKDINQNSQAAPELSNNYTEIGKLHDTTPKTTVNSDWDNAIDSNHKPFYNLYKQSSSILNKTAVISKQLFDTLLHGGNS